MSKFLVIALPLLRITLTVSVMILGFTQQWKAAFICCVVAWLIGKFGSWRRWTDILAYAGFTLGPSLVLVIYSINHYSWSKWQVITLILIYLLAIVSTVWMLRLIKVTDKTKPQKIIVAATTLSMFAVQGVTVIWLAYMFGEVIDLPYLIVSPAIVLINQSFWMECGQLHKWVKESPV